MLDITLQNFETDVIQASADQPVLLDLWAPWCGPCRTLGPVLERLETAYAGRFKLGKLNSDDQPEIAGQLSQMFGVRSIPFCVMFKGGQPVDGFVGALPEAQIRAFLDKHVPGEDELAAEQGLDDAEALLAEGDPEAAIDRLQEAVAINPANDTARFEYLRALLGLGRLDEARTAYLPVKGRVLTDPRLAACGHWIDAFDAAAAARPPAALEAAIAADKRDFDARFERAQVAFASQRFTEAMDELLEIIMRDKNWKDGLARKHYVAILELMEGPASAADKDAAAPKGVVEVQGKPLAARADPVRDAYRRKLSMAIF